MFGKALVKRYVLMLVTPEVIEGLIEQGLDWVGAQAASTSARWDDQLFATLRASLDVPALARKAHGFLQGL